MTEQERNSAEEEKEFAMEDSMPEFKRSECYLLHNDIFAKQQTITEGMQAVVFIGQLKRVPDSPLYSKLLENRFNRVVLKQYELQK
jgi:hypothetical protein